MAAPSLLQLQELWTEDDGALFDIFATRTTLEDWQAVVDAVREKSWAMTYTVNGVVAEMPKTVEGIFASRQTEATILWSIKVGVDVTINCHFSIRARSSSTSAPARSSATRRSPRRLTSSLMLGER